MPHGSGDGGSRRGAQERSVNCACVLWEICSQSFVTVNACCMVSGETALCYHRYIHHQSLARQCVGEVPRRVSKSIALRLRSGLGTAPGMNQRMVQQVPWLVISRGATNLASRSAPLTEATRGLAALCSTLHGTKDSRASSLALSDEGRRLALTFVGQ
jgi:hypothetical protein